MVVHEGGKREKKRRARDERADGTYLPETKGVQREEGGCGNLSVWMGGNGLGTLVPVVVQPKGRRPKEMIIILPRVHQ